MSVLVACRDARPDNPIGALLPDVLAALRDALPDVFVLVVCRRAPHDLPPSPCEDWVCLGDDWDDEATERCIASLAEMHGAPAMLCLDENFPASHPASLRLFHWRDGAERSALLARLSALIPYSLVRGPENDLSELPSQLAARPDAPAIQLHWSGGTVRALADLARAAVELDARPIQLQVGLPELIRGSARGVLLSIPKEVELRLVAEDEYSLGAAAAAETLLRKLRRERPRAAVSDAGEQAL